MPGPSLPNVVFGWDLDSLTEIYPMEGPAPHITLEMLIKAIKLINCDKAAATYLIVAEMLKAELKGLSRPVI